MKSFPSMRDMQRTPEDKAKDSPMGLVTPNISDCPDYDYGLCGSFNKESLDKLDLDDKVNVGDYLHIVSFAKVTGVHMRPGSDEVDRVEWCLCHIAVEDEAEETQDDDGEA